MKRPAAAPAPPTSGRMLRRVDAVGGPPHREDTLRADTMPMAGGPSMHDRIDAALGGHGGPAAAEFPPPPAGDGVVSPFPAAVPTVIPLPKRRAEMQPVLVPLHERVKDRICAVHTDPIVLSAYVKEEYCILLCQAYPASAQRADVLTLTGRRFACMDPFLSFPDEIATLPACPQWSSA